MTIAEPQAQGTLETLIKWGPLLDRSMKPSDVTDIYVESVEQNYPFLKISSRTGNRGRLGKINRYLRNLALPSCNFTAENYGAPHANLYAEWGTYREWDRGEQGFLYAESAMRVLMEQGELESYYDVIRKLNALTVVELDGEGHSRCAQIVGGPPDGKPVVRINVGNSEPDSNWGPYRKPPALQPDVATSFRDELNKTLGTHMEMLPDYLNTHRDYSTKGPDGKAMAKDLTPYSILEIPLDALMKNLKSMNALLDKYLKTQTATPGRESPSGLSNQR